MRGAGVNDCVTGLSVRDWHCQPQFCDWLPDVMTAWCDLLMRSDECDRLRDPDCCGWCYLRLFNFLLTVDRMTNDPWCLQARCAIATGGSAASPPSRLMNTVAVGCGREFCECGVQCDMLSGSTPR